MMAKTRQDLIFDIEAYINEAADQHRIDRLDLLVFELNKLARFANVTRNRIRSGEVRDEWQSQR